MSTGESSFEEMIQSYGAELAEEMNLRLICGILPQESEMLWVESICVAEIVYPQPKPVKQGFLKCLKNFLRRIVRRVIAFFRRWFGRDK
jgi:hypothetical protein